MNSPSSPDPARQTLIPPHGNFPAMISLLFSPTLWGKTAAQMPESLVVQGSSSVPKIFAVQAAKSVLASSGGCGLREGIGAGCGPGDPSASPQGENGGRP